MFQLIQYIPFDKYKAVVIKNDKLKDLSDEQIQDLYNSQRKLAELAYEEWQRLKQLAKESQIPPGVPTPVNGVTVDLPSTITPLEDQPPTNS
jgi:hypothetical protein